SRRRHTRSKRDWSSDVCSSDLGAKNMDKVIIIGAGPAGLSAAITLAKHHKDVTVIDEYLEAGGRLLGQLYEESNGKWWNGMKERSEERRVGKEWSGRCGRST